MIYLALSAVAFATLWAALWRRSRFGWLPSSGRATEQRANGAVHTVHFPAVDGTMLEGWLFLPAFVVRPPVVVMAPGLGGTKDGFLESFAWTFVARGLAVLVFDYRGFGGSQGSPRHWVAPPRHRQDYAAALRFAQRELGDRVDVSRIGLWGSSFSGGTALVTAVDHEHVRAVVAQCPYLKTPPHIEPRGLAMMRFVLCAMLDMLRIFPPIYVPLFGRPGQWVFAPSAENPSVDDFGGELGSEFWRQLPKPPLGGWENRMLARGLTTLDQVVPLNEVSKLKCPVLFVAALRDDMVPSAYVEQAHQLCPGSELTRFDCGHFDLYVGSVHTQNALLQADFLARALTVRDSPPATTGPLERAGLQRRRTRTRRTTTRHDCPPR